MFSVANSSTAVSITSSGGIFLIELAITQARLYCTFSLFRVQFKYGKIQNENNFFSFGSVNLHKSTENLEIVM